MLEMMERKSKIDTCGGCMTTGSSGQCFRLAGPSCKLGKVRTAVGVIFGNGSPMVKLDDRWIQIVCRERESISLE